MENTKNCPTIDYLTFTPAANTNGKPPYSLENKRFSNGDCATYAAIRSLLFGEKIYYNPIQDHFVTEKDGVFYDVKGVYPRENRILYSWESFLNFEPIQAKRIYARFPFLAPEYSYIWKGHAPKN